MAALTPAQQTQYFAQEGSKAAPLSPMDWLAKQMPSASAPVATLGSTMLGPTAPSPITYNVSNANTPATLYTMPGATSMPDWRATLASFADEQSPEQIAAANEQKTLQQSILDRLSGFGEKMGMMDQQTGMSDTQKQLDEVYGQINGLQTEAQAIPLQVQQDSEGRGRTEAGIAPIEGDLTRTNAIKALGLSARASVLQGRLGQAKQQMDRLMQVQQMELDYLKTALSFNGSRMDEADQKQAARIGIRLKERQDALDQQRQSSDTVMQMLLKAKAGGAPDSVITKAHEMDPVGAMGLLSAYLKDKTDLMTVSPGQTVIDPTTGKPIYQAPFKPENDQDSFNFTDTQLANAATNAKISIADLAKYTNDDKNFFANGLLKLQQDKDLTDTEKADLVRNSTVLSPDAKMHVLQLLGVGAANADTGGGWLRGIGSTIMGWLSGIGQ